MKLRPPSFYLTSALALSGEDCTIYFAKAATFFLSSFCGIILSLLIFIRLSMARCTCDFVLERTSNQLKSLELNETSSLGVGSSSISLSSSSSSSQEDSSSDECFFQGCLVFCATAAVKRERASSAALICCYYYCCLIILNLRAGDISSASSIPFFCSPCVCPGQNGLNCLDNADSSSSSMICLPAPALG